MFILCSPLFVAHVTREDGLPMSNAWFRRFETSDANNDITDVDGVRVGQITLQRLGRLTGTTVALPRTGRGRRRRRPRCRARDPRDRPARPRPSGRPGPRDRAHRRERLRPRDRRWRHGGVCGRGARLAHGRARRGRPDRPAAVVSTSVAEVRSPAGRGPTTAALPRRRPRRRNRSGSARPGRSRTGAKAGSLAGGVGSASVRLPDGSTVAALVVVNAVGSPVDARTGELPAARHFLPGTPPPR